ncbi:MAG TPA: hypothetical protein DCY07_07840 [Rhodospirillaceae bacterium]|nr:hypothetical protein [Rhodospirillaceae bacterium]
MMIVPPFARLLSVGPLILLVFVALAGAGSVAAQNLIPLAKPVKLPPALLHLPDQPETSLESVMKKSGQDRYYLLHLWAPSCAACIPEMRQLDKIHEGLAQQGFTVLFVAQDSSGNFTVPAFSRRHDIATISSYIDKRATLLNYLQPAGLPATYLTTPDGWIIAYHVGSLDWKQMATMAPPAEAKPQR